MEWTGIGLGIGVRVNARLCQVPVRCSTLSGDSAGVSSSLFSGGAGLSGGDSLPWQVRGEGAQAAPHWVTGVTSAHAILLGFQ